MFVNREQKKLTQSINYLIKSKLIFMVSLKGMKRREALIGNKFTDVYTVFRERE